MIRETRRGAGTLLSCSDCYREWMVYQSTDDKIWDNCYRHWRICNPGNKMKIPKRRKKVSTTK